MTSKQAKKIYKKHLPLFHTFAIEYIQYLARLNLIDRFYKSVGKKNMTVEKVLAECKKHPNRKF